MNLDQGSPKESSRGGSGAQVAIVLVCLARWPWGAKQTQTGQTFVLSASSSALARRLVCVVVVAAFDLDLVCLFRFRFAQFHLVAFGLAGHVALRRAQNSRRRRWPGSESR